MKVWVVTTRDTGKLIGVWASKKNAEDSVPETDEYIVAEWIVADGQTADTSHRTWAACCAAIKEIDHLKAMISLSGQYETALKRENDALRNTILDIDDWGNSE